MENAVFVDPLNNGSEGDDVVKPVVVIDGVALSSKVLSVLMCMQSENNAYIHEIRDHILKFISHSLEAMDYLDDKEAAEMLEDIRYMNKFLKCIDSLSI
jgi:hypothetical protein